MAETAPLLRVCQLLNEAGVKYLICGAQACVLHGLVRTTEDVDILVEPTRELTPKDILENVVVKVADEVEVDVSTHAWKVTYADAIGSAKETVIEGVKIPFLSLDSLIASKETYREQDASDRLRLLELKRRSPEH